MSMPVVFIENNKGSVIVNIKYENVLEAMNEVLGLSKSACENVLGEYGCYPDNIEGCNYIDADILYDVLRDKDDLFEHCETTLFYKVIRLAGVGESMAKVVTRINIEEEEAWDKLMDDIIDE